MEKNSNDVDFTQNSFLALECLSKQNRDSLREMTIDFTFTQESLTINTFVSLIYHSFHLTTKKISLYDWKGIEVIEDADLANFAEDNGTRVLFFMKRGDFFDNRNILRLFNLEKQLGEGGFGKVYLASLKKSVKRYAIKFLRHQKTNDIDYLFKEINLLLRLEHANIIKLHSYFATEDGRIAFIMDYASGGTLKNYVESKGKLDEDIARPILFQILKTIEYCHEEGIIHRDLKTDNILFTDLFHINIKVIDFGISTLLNAKTRAGSLAYISPEVLSGADSSSLPSVDIWAIGCVLYELVTGQRMFQGKCNEEIKRKILNRTIQFPTYLSVECVNLIDSLVDINPNQRITIDQALRHPWIRKEKLKELAEIAKTNNLIHHRKVLQFKKRSKIKLSMNELMINTNNLFTKISNVKEEVFFNYSLSSRLKIPSYMAPIGHDRKQKNTLLKLRDFYTLTNTAIKAKKIKENDKNILPLLNSAPQSNLEKNRTIKVKRRLNLDFYS